MARRSGVGLKLRTRRGGLSQPLSQCKHVLIEIRSSGYNSFADVAARPPFAHPPTLTFDVCSRCAVPHHARIVTLRDRNLINFTGASRFSYTCVLLLASWGSRGEEGEEGDCFEPWKLGESFLEWSVSFALNSNETWNWFSISWFSNISRRMEFCQLLVDN